MSRLLAAASLLFGCAGEPETVTLDVYSWWREPSERLAFDDVIRIHEDAHPDIQVENRADPNSKDLRKIVAGRMLASAPPSTFQANIGADLVRWAVVDTDNGSLPSRNLLKGLSGLFERSGGGEPSLASALPEALARALSVGADGVPFAVPLNVHRLNVLYYNPGLVAPELLSIDKLCPSGEATKLSASIAIGLYDPHTLFLLAFENVLPALAGAKFYDDLFRGRPAPGWEAEVSRTLACVQYLSRSFSHDSASLTWANAAQRVASGDAAFTVMGDWANGELADELDAHTVELMPFPGTVGTFVFTADTFPMPRDAPNPDETMALLETMTSRRAQQAFSAQKGSIPARFDIDRAELGPRAQQTRDDFMMATDRVLATSGLLPPYYPLDQLTARLNEMIAPSAGQKEIGVVVDLMQRAEPLLAVWQDRLDKGPAQ